MKRQLTFTTKKLRSRTNRRPRHHYSNLPFLSHLSQQLSSNSTIASVNNNNNNQFRKLAQSLDHSLSEYSCIESVKKGQFLSSLIVKESEISSIISKSEVSVAEIGNGVFEFDPTCSDKLSVVGQIDDDDDDDDDDDEEDSLESSGYTSSIWSNESGSEFSVGDESSSQSFQMFCLFKQKFCRSGFVSTDCAVDVDADGCPLLGLEDEVEEENYRMIRKRERRQVYLHDYAEAYCTSNHGELVIQQRLRMVHWIVEQATKQKLQVETMFLGVNFLDRVLSIGYFKNKDALQIAGIACLTLATRIEEKQPYNCVQTETFCVGNATYYRSEVVGMEWLVMDVLNFKCFLPTVYNFLWYYLKAARANKKLEKTAKYLGVLALMGHQQLCFWPSTVAAALVILASIATSEHASCHLMTAIHSREKDDSLPECIKSLEWLVQYL